MIAVHYMGEEGGGVVRVWGVGRGKEMVEGVGYGAW